MVLGAIPIVPRSLATRDAAPGPACVDTWILYVSQPDRRRIFYDSDAGSGYDRGYAVCRQAAVDRGTNGLTGYNSILGFNLNAPSTKIGLYFITLAALAGAYILCRRIVNSRVGQVLEASRDGENRVRFLGFDPSRYKTFAFAVSGGLAGLAGMLFVLQVGIISPSMMGIVPSIEMVLWVALGGRGTLIGAIIGAVLLNAAKTGISEAYPEGWLLVLGALFVIVVVLMPKGLTGLWSKVVSSLSRRGGTVHAAVREES